MANEIKQAKTQIKRRMGIGSHISERRLIDELCRMGMNESIIRRALLIMHQRDEVEYKRGRRIIVRKAKLDPLDPCCLPSSIYVLLKRYIASDGVYVAIITFGHFACKMFIFIMTSTNLLLT